MHQARIYASLLFLAGLLAWPHAAQAQDSPAAAFRISGVEVEAIGSSSTEARNRALADGRVVASRRMLRRLTLPEDHNRLPGVTSEQAEQLISGSQVESEQIGPTRYVGRLSYIFDRESVGALLESAGIPYVRVASQPVLVLPVTVNDSGRPALWEEPNQWRDAWTLRSWDDGLVPFVDPVGDLQDLQAISAEQAVTAQRPALRLIAGRYDAGYVLVAVARRGESGMAIDLTRFNALTGQTEGLGERSVAGGAEAMRETANAIARELEERWKRDNMVAAGEGSTLVAQVPIENYGYWVRLRRNLGQVALIQRDRVLNLTPTEARIELVYAGRVQQLQSALAQVGLVLRENPTAGYTENGARTGAEEAARPADGADRTRPGREAPEDDRAAGLPADDPRGEPEPAWILSLGLSEGR